MKAAVIRAYGLPEVVRVDEIEKPVPGPDEILVRVKSASLNALDKHLTKGVILARPKIGWFKPRNPVLGSDLAGTVEAVGEKVSEYKPGDKVFGGILQGAFAEYACVKVDRAAHIPDGLSFQEAAALPVAAGTALQALKHGRIEAGQKVLINGATGGVGPYLVQLSKYFGAHTTAVCSGRNGALALSLGADEHINYQTDPLTGLNRKFDLIIDNVGSIGISDYKRLLTPTGNCVVVGMTTIGGLLNTMIRAPFVSSKKGQTITLLDTTVNHKDLTTLAGMLASGKLKSYIEKEYHLEEIKAAMELLWSRRAKGKLIINI